MELIEAESLYVSAGNSWTSSLEYDDRELVIHASVPFNNWVKAGYLRQIIDLANGVQLTLANRLIYLNQYQPLIFLPTTTLYRLVFTPNSWLPNYTINLFKLDMPLTFEPIATSPTASSATSATVPISTTSVSIIAANANRKKLIVANNSNQDMYLDLDATASVADYAIKIPKVTASGFIASYELEGYTGVASGIWAAAGTGAALVRELV